MDSHVDDVLSRFVLKTLQKLINLSWSEFKCNDANFLPNVIQWTDINMQHKHKLRKNLESQELKIMANYVRLGCQSPPLMPTKQCWSFYVHCFEVVSIHTVDALKWQLIWHVKLTFEFIVQSSHQIGSTTNTKIAKELFVASDVTNHSVRFWISRDIHLRDLYSI